MNLEELARALEGALPELDENGVRLALALYHQLATGKPVSEGALAAETQLPAGQIGELLSTWPGIFRDDDGNIVGFWGLAVVDMPPHRYCLGDTQMSVWCAFDPLFIPRLLGTEAQVESVDGWSGEPISLTIAPGGVQQSSSSEMVLSFLRPDGKFDADVVVNFCHFVHFFATRENGERWAAEHPGVFLLDMGEADALAERFAGSIVHGRRVTLS